MYPLVTRNAVTGTGELMQLAPIPPHLVYNGFEADLDTARVFERVMGASNTDTAVFTHLKHFLRACLSTHNSADNKPYVIGTEFSAAPSMAAHRWAKTKFEKFSQHFQVQGGQQQMKARFRRAKRCSILSRRSGAQEQLAPPP